MATVYLEGIADGEEEHDRWGRLMRAVRVRVGERRESTWYCVHASRVNLYESDWIISADDPLQERYQQRQEVLHCISMLVGRWLVDRSVEDELPVRVDMPTGCARQ